MRTINFQFSTLDMHVIFDPKTKQKITKCAWHHQHTGTNSLSKFLLSLWWLRLHALSASGCSKSNFTCFFLFPFIYLFLIFLNCYINELLILSETPSICLHSHVLLCWSWLNITFHNACLIMNLASLFFFCPCYPCFISLKSYNFYNF